MIHLPGFPAATRAAVSAGLALAMLCACSGEFPASAPSRKAAEDRFDAALLTQSLDAIEAWHVERRTGLAASLESGRSRSSVVDAFSGTDCHPTEEMQVLWSWRDGAIGAVPFVWYHDFLPLREALSEYRKLLRNPLVAWDPRYVPVFSFEGEWYAAYCGKDATSAGPVVHLFIEDEPRITHVNLTTFVASMAQALRSGAVRWRDGAMVEDIGWVRRIHQEYNEGYAFPYHVAE